MNAEEWRHQIFMIQWIIVDCFIILLQRYYIYLCQMMMMSGEMMKNIYTLQLAQNKKLTERRNQKELEINDVMGNRLSEFFKQVAE